MFLVVYLLNILLASGEMIYLSFLKLALSSVDLTLLNDGLDLVYDLRVAGEWGDELKYS